MDKLMYLNTSVDTLEDKIRKLNLRISNPLCVDGGSYIYILHDPESGFMVVYAEDEPIKFREIKFE